MMAVKRCPKCGETKSRTEFGVRRNGHSRSACKPCESAQFAATYHRDKDKAALSYRRSHLKRRYGVTVEQYDALLIEQAGRCKLCGAEECGAGRKYLCVDHDHTTGAIRGLLCNSCNRALGALRDDPDLIDRAAEYVRRSGQIDGAS